MRSMVEPDVPTGLRELKGDNHMGLFSRSKMQQCLFCSTSVDSSIILEHYVDHLIEVTDNNGHRAYTFKCPRCGLMDQAWGGGRPNPQSNATSAIVVHLMERHGIPMP